MARLTDMKKLLLLIALVAAVAGVLVMLQRRSDPSSDF